MLKPTRRVRRFVRKTGKGSGKNRKGEAKGARRFQFLAGMSDQEYGQAFFGGKGKSKGHPRTSGKEKAAASTLVDMMVKS